MLRSAQSILGLFKADRFQPSRWFHKRPGRLVAVSSGKGGTGKSILTTNVAVAYARKRYRVAVIDADLGLANAHLLLGMAPRFNLSHFLHDRMSLEDIADDGPFGVRLISGGSGISELAALDDVQILHITREIDRLRENYDWIFVDTSAGIGPQTLLFLYEAREVILVTTPDVTALTDAYAVLKTLHQQDPDLRVSFVVNRVTSDAEGTAAFDRITRAASKFLDRDVPCLGTVVQDPEIGASVARKTPLLAAAPHCRAAKDLRAIARALRRSPAPSGVAGSPRG
ncbi:MAG: MinD/ParA family protein [Planctomycetes bacterium]|nr:MinD/ParA family protein [Planctomycetota bacterium]MBI3846903.1 MinD/ParA family protein [Planctomycetota bacterium]